MTRDIDELISQIKADYQNLMKEEEPLTITVLPTGRSAATIDGRFVFSQVLIDCLLRLTCNDTDRAELLSAFKQEYKNNIIELGKLQDFEENYSFNKALWWYTRDSFFYRTLNAALRRQDIRMIILYRSCISHIYRHLQVHQSKDPIRVYRSQLMSSEEIKNLQKCKDQFISMNSFLSTSSEQPMALFYMGDRSQTIDLERVLFEIDADPTAAVAKPFADISPYSCFKSELEVLFMLGSIFRLDDVIRGQDHIWTVKMTLCSDNDHHLEPVLTYMKNQNGFGETNFHTLSKLLWKMGQSSLSKKYYNQLLDELETHDPLRADIYEELSAIASHECQHDKSIEFVQKALEIREHLKSTSVIKENTSRYYKVPWLHHCQLFCSVSSRFIG